jgi:predicted HAD superfamily Cof-like phosphohydrolase
MARDYADWECRDLQAMYRHYQFPTNDESGFLPDRVMEDRLGYIHEEVKELAEAIRNSDLPGVADALVDIAVFCKGTAVMMGLPWEKLWEEVHRANMSKQPGENDKRPGFANDLVKPEGWIPPRIQEILDGSL